MATGYYGNGLPCFRPETYVKTFCEINLIVFHSYIKKGTSVPKNNKTYPRCDIILLILPIIIQI